MAVIGRRCPGTQSGGGEAASPVTAASGSNDREECKTRSTAFVTRPRGETPVMSAASARTCVRTCTDAVLERSIEACHTRLPSHPQYIIFNLLRPHLHRGGVRARNRVLCASGGASQISTGVFKRSYRARHICNIYRTYVRTRTEAVFARALDACHARLPSHPL